jgi:hypothetical protein
LNLIRVMPAKGQESAMQAAVLIARLAGPIFVAIGIGMLLNEPVYAAMIAEAVQSHILIYLSGLLSLAAGLAVLSAYRAWSADWRVIVTILGWLLTVGGVVRIVLPQVPATLAPRIYSGPMAFIIVAVIALAVGGYLSFEGYRAHT